MQISQKYRKNDYTGSAIIVKWNWALQKSK